MSISSSSMFKGKKVLPVSSSNLKPADSKILKMLLDLGFLVWYCRRTHLGFTSLRAKLHMCVAFCSGAGLSFRNSQICPTRFRISELGNLVQIFRHSIGPKSHSHLDNCLMWFTNHKCSFKSRLPQDWRP